MRRDLIGDTLLNQFRVETYIASGGMATIYRVWDMQRSVPLAMKVLHPELAEDPAFIARFQREARSLEMLIHPHIVPFYGLFQVDEVSFLLERYIDGPTLDELLRQRAGKPLPMVEALVYFKALYTSLGYAHAQGIIHCDVKPGNVLIDQGGHVYLTDFGISRYMDAAITTSSSLGTPLYMAPEQIRGERTSPQTDIYALGVVLFELLTGQRPFKGEDVPEGVGENLSDRIRYQHMFVAPPDPRQVNPAVPEGLAKVVLRALTKDPAERYPNMQAMADEIARVIAARFETLPNRVRLPEDPGSGWSPAPVENPVAKAAAVGSALGGAGSAQPPDNDSGWTWPSEPRPQDTLPGAAPPYRPAPPPQRARPTNALRLAAAAGVLGLLVLCWLAGARLAQGLNLGGLGSGAGKNPSVPLPAETRANTPAGELPTGTQSPTGTQAPTHTQSPSSTTQPTSAPTATDQPAAPTTTQSGEPLSDFPVQGQVIIVRRAEDGDRLFLLDMASGAQEPLPTVPDVSVLHDNAPQWSPDGTRLAWISQYGGRQHVAAMELEEREPYQLPAGEAYSRVSSPAFQPGGGRISFWSTGGDDANRLVIADAVSGERVEEVELQGYRNMYVWNPQSGIPAFIYSGSESYEVGVSESAAGPVLPVEAGGEGYAPSWSHDGAWLAFQSDAGRESGMNEIWIARSDGTDLREVTSTPDGYWSRAPTWSPDGRMIAFVSNRSGSIGNDYGELFVVDLGTGQIRQMTNTGGQVYDWRPAWRP